MSEQLYTEKGDLYYATVRRELIRLIPEGTTRMLDVGCGTGATGALAKELGLVSEVVGVEFHGPAAELARARLDLVVTGDIEEVDLDIDRPFDCILCADVIEHTKDPWAVLRKLRPLLADDGVLVASIPNFRHLHPLLKIVSDRYEYMESGILDKTHLRIFTLHTMRKLFEETGFRIDNIHRNYSTRWMFRFARIASLGFLAPFTIYQYLLCVRKDSQ